MESCLTCRHAHRYCSYITIDGLKNSTIWLQSPGQEEFASDALPSISTEINRDTVQVRQTEAGSSCSECWIVQAELGQLGVSSREKEEGVKEGEESNVWEEQLQQELQDMELEGLSGMGEGGGGGEEVDTEAWEAELQEMLDMHSQEPTQN